MPKIRYSFILTILPFFNLSGAYTSDFCDQIEKEYEKRTLISKVSLYDTKIGINDIIKLERDKDEIPVGQEVLVKDVKCAIKKTTFTLEAINYSEAEVVEIYFFIHYQHSSYEGGRAIDVGALLSAPPTAGAGRAGISRGDITERNGGDLYRVGRIPAGQRVGDRGAGLVWQGGGKNGKSPSPTTNRFACD